MEANDLLLLLIIPLNFQMPKKAASNLTLIKLQVKAM